MKKIMKVIVGILSVVVFYLGAFIVHVVTCVAVYENFGFFLGIIAFFSPVISTIIMFLLYLIFYGLFNGYCLFILGYLGAVAFTYFLAYKTEEIKEKRPYVEYNNTNYTTANYSVSSEKIINTYVDERNLLENTSKYITLSNIVINGLEVETIDEAIDITYNFYKSQEIDVDSITLDYDNKPKYLSELVMLGLGTDDIDKTISNTSKFYEDKRIDERLKINAQNTNSNEFVDVKRYCNNCGHQLQENANFCNNCGNIIRKGE